MTATITDTQGIIAIVGVAVGVLALVGLGLLSRSVRRLRAAQSVVIGDGDQRDLIAHAADLQHNFQALAEHLTTISEELDARLRGLETALEHTIAHRSLVRYDAYNELSGQQSMSIALLDEMGSGIVLSCIHHRDQARVYAKQIYAGKGELELSPEEDEAIRVALAEPQVRPRSESAAG